MNVPFYGHVRQYRSIQSEIDANIREVLESGEYVLGPTLERFEREFAAFSGARHAIGVGNGTDAIWLALAALGIGPGDECITTANTFFATAQAIWIAGATAVFADTCPRTNNIDPALVEAAITERTRAIVPVHLYGQCADMQAIRRIADRHGLFVVEDNAQAVCAHGDGFRPGELGDAAATSFITNKNLGTFGDGGMVTTNDEGLARRLRLLRNHGSERRGYHSFGFNSRLDDLHAAVLRAKLRHIEEWTVRRRALAARYTARLENARRLTPPWEAPGYRHVFHLYVVETKQPELRDPLAAFLARRGVETKCHYPIPIHRQEGFHWGKGARIAGPLPHSERNAASCVSLPLFPELTDEEADYAAAACLEWDGAV